MLSLSNQLTKLTKLMKLTKLIDLIKRTKAKVNKLQLTQSQRNSYHPINQKSRHNSNLNQ